MSDIDSARLDWLLGRLGIDREWLDHANLCKTCFLDLGDEYGGGFTCRQWDLDHNLRTFGPETHAQHRHREQFQALYAPMIEQMLKPMPNFKTIEKARPGEIVTYRRFTSHDEGK